MIEFLDERAFDAIVAWAAPEGRGCDSFRRMR